MAAKHVRVSLALAVLFACSVGITPRRSYAGAAAIGLVAGSTGTTVSGQQARYSTALFNSDDIQVRDPGLAIVRLTDGGSVVLSKKTSASFWREADDVNVRLSRGSLTLQQPARAGAVKVTAEGISVEPVRGFKTLGEIALLNGRLSVRATEGRFRLEGRGVRMEAAQGKTITLNTAAAAAPQGTAVSAGLLGSHAAKVAAFTAAGGTGAAVGVTSLASHGASTAVLTLSALSSEGHGSGKGEDSAPEPRGDNDEGKNQTAINNVAAHAPAAACEHAASPSVPSVACSEDAD